MRRIPIPKPAFPQTVVVRRPVTRLLLLSLLTLSLGGIAFAGYRKSVDGADTAQVAKVSVSLAANSGQWSNAAGRTDQVLIGQDLGKEYTFTITNSSQVAMRGKLNLTGNTNANPVYLYIGAVSNGATPLTDWFDLTKNGNTTVILRIYGKADPLGTATALGNGGSTTQNIFTDSSAGIQISFDFEQKD